MLAFLLPTGVYSCLLIYDKDNNALQPNIGNTHKYTNLMQYNENPLHGRIVRICCQQGGITCSFINKFPSCLRNKAYVVGKKCKLKECCFLCLVGIPSKLV